jgi:hypothetical protein
MTTVWRDAQSLKAELVEDGWKSPDTYCRWFEPLKNRPAVYLFLLHRPYNEACVGFTDAIVAYVGMSQRVRTRIHGHDILPLIEAPNAWVMRWFKPTAAKALRETEGHYIRRFNPPWNIVGKPRGIVIQ